MLISDPALPALIYLVGPSAHDVLAAVVEHAGGMLHSARVSEVQYLPGQEVVVRYRCEVEWGDGRVRSEVLLAGAVQGGVIPDTIPVVADSPNGELQVSVWRYPFDPLLPGLTGAVSTSYIRESLPFLATGDLSLEVLAYRPTDRAVVRVRDADGLVVYIKAVRPDTTTALIERHQRLCALGLPVAEVIAADEDSGLLVLEELPGMTLRDRIKAESPVWPDPEELVALTALLRELPAEGLDPVHGRVRDALSHAELPMAVEPGLAPAVSRLADFLSSKLYRVDERSGPVIHGDLHEGQIIVDDAGSVTGLLDIDDLGPGDPLDDLATFVAHLWFGSTGDLQCSNDVAAYVDRVLVHFGNRCDLQELNASVAAVLLGLATGPFRIQMPYWQQSMRQLVDKATSVAVSAGMHRD